ncbi:hypothetical protein GFS24_03905 [Chitinophaga sp. SYP-B3965]|uniref:hypothetical protein n=1 Tax=Chitinophaga sp. SYP-B3965 TaxID=2663120 RepID=UPI00129A07CA|nr:hypothetical protein [Chitinophaga sp. SYP-B3965]MRG44241.1 hypothetical protein [Chitinophaga sp. SYP-B3965]
MPNHFIKTLLVLFLTIASIEIFAQDNNFEQLSKIPKATTTNFPLDYKIARPRLEYPHWDHDFDIYYNFLTPTLRKTQASLSQTSNGVVSTMTPNSIIPHAQLDTATIVDDPTKFMGTWRMISFRAIRYNDSVFIPTKVYYRLADTLLEDKSSEEAFAVISDNNFKLYARETGKTDFKRMISAKYKIENRRFMMMYKLVKASAGVSQIGIDEKGYLILNYPSVIENIKKGGYFSYYAIVEQYIFEKVK